MFCCVSSAISLLFFSCFVLFPFVSDRSEAYSLWSRFLFSEKGKNLLSTESTSLWIDSIIHHARTPRSNLIDSIMSLSELPILTNGPDQLRHGISSTAGGAPPSLTHPVQLIEQTFAKQQDANQKNLLARVYGSHLPMKLHMEQVRKIRKQIGKGDPIARVMRIFILKMKSNDEGDHANKARD